MLLASSTPAPGSANCSAKQLVSLPPGYCVCNTTCGELGSIRHLVSDSRERDGHHVHTMTESNVVDEMVMWRAYITLDKVSSLEASCLGSNSFGMFQRGTVRAQHIQLLLARVSMEHVPACPTKSRISYTCLAASGICVTVIVCPYAYMCKHTNQQAPMTLWWCACVTCQMVCRIPSWFLQYLRTPTSSVVWSQLHIQQALARQVSQALVESH